MEKAKIIFDVITALLGLATAYLAYKKSEEAKTISTAKGRLEELAFGKKKLDAVAKTEYIEETEESSLFGDKKKTTRKIASSAHSQAKEEFEQREAQQHRSIETAEYYDQSYKIALWIAAGLLVVSFITGFVLAEKIKNESGNYNYYKQFYDDYRNNDTSRTSDTPATTEIIEQPSSKQALATNSGIARNEVGEDAIIDNVHATLFPDPIFSSNMQWQGKKSGRVELPHKTPGRPIVYYGQLDSGSINGFGIFWIPLENGDDAYELFLGRRMGGRAQGPGIRVNSDGSYYSAIFNDGSPVSNRKDYYADGTDKPSPSN